MIGSKQHLLYSSSKLYFKLSRPAQFRKHAFCKLRTCLYNRYPVSDNETSNFGRKIIASVLLKFV
ncbi:MAG: hypothetical protein U9R28_10365 [Pseudomonadota bacterium]|nr:hypothetical protein [Pseudomonadota bacterium]